MPETPITRRYSLPTTVLVVSDLDSTDLQVSVDVTPGGGILVMCDVISEVVDTAR